MSVDAAILILADTFTSYLVLELAEKTGKVFVLAKFFFEVGVYTKSIDFLWAIITFLDHPKFYLKILLPSMSSSSTYEGRLPT